MTLSRRSSYERPERWRKGVKVDNDTNSDLLGLLKKGLKYDDNSFQKLFWKQQMKAASLKNTRSIKWHPLMIKWCLYLVVIKSCNLKEILSNCR